MKDEIENLLSSIEKNVEWIRRELYYNSIPGRRFIDARLSTIERKVNNVRESVGKLHESTTG